MAVFPLLRDVARYQPNLVDMAGHAPSREYWLRVFEENRASMMRHAVEAEGGGEEVHRRARAYSEAFGCDLEAVRRAPEKHPRLSIGHLCGVRRQRLLEHGFIDPYVLVKQRENAAALRLLPALLEEIDRTPSDGRLKLLIENVFAGNLFDLGCSGTIRMYEAGEMDFHATRRRLPPRPWLVDHLDELAGRLQRRPPRKSLVFVDNAGADIVLGMVPLARYLLSLGAQVILTANTHPALNDITHEELVPLLKQIAAIDPVVAEGLERGHLVCVPSGNDKPVIDLREVGDELVESCDGVDLLVLEGMGRALETNYRAPFACDTLKIAMVKEPDIAEQLGGKNYDVVCRFDAAG